MAVKLYTETPKDDAIVVPYTLEFEEDGDGIMVNAVSADNTFSLVKFNEDGTIYLFEGIDSSSGFKVTSSGKLAITKEY